MILEVFESILTAYKTELSVTTSKGYPNWARPDLVTPCAALEFAGFQPYKDRIGQTISTSSITFRGWLFARDEPQLCAMVDALIEWHRTDGSAFEAAARRVACMLQALERHDPLTSNINETHAVTFLLQVVY